MKSPFLEHCKLSINQQISMIDRLALHDQTIEKVYLEK